MNKLESLWGPERGRHLFKTSETAVRMVAERIILEDLNLPLKVLPLCTEEESVNIDELIPRAMEGFALSLQAINTTRSQDIDLLAITKPISIEGIWSNIALTARQNTLSEYHHVFSSLAFLSQTGRVCFNQFPDPPVNIDFETADTETYWFNSTDTFERVWRSMEELENVTRKALFSKESMSKKDMLKVGHFFMTGKHISRVFEDL